MKLLIVYFCFLLSSCNVYNKELSELNQFKGKPLEMFLNNKYYNNYDSFYALADPPSNIEGVVFVYESGNYEIEIYLEKNNLFYLNNDELNKVSKNKILEIKKYKLSKGLEISNN